MSKQKNLTLYLILFLGPNLFGQTKDLSIPKYGNGEISSWVEWENERIDRFKLADLKRTSDSVYLRLSTDNQIVDIYSKDGKTFGGHLMILTSSYDEEQKKKSKYYSLLKAFSGDSAKQIFELFKKFKLKDVPTDSEIKGWHFGTDGKTYIFEFATRDKYSFKTYWTPELSVDLEEGVSINGFVTQLTALLEFDRRTDAFFDSLPKNNCYRFGSMIIRCIQKH